MIVNKWRYYEQNPAKAEKKTHIANIQSLNILKRKLFASTPETGHSTSYNNPIPFQPSSVAFTYLFDNNVCKALPLTL